jgi:hypothetical protein
MRRSLRAMVLLCLCLLAVLLIVYAVRQGPSPPLITKTGTAVVAINNRSSVQSNAPDLGSAAISNSSPPVNNTSTATSSPQPPGKTPGRPAGGSRPANTRGPPNGDWKNGPFNGHMPGGATNATAAGGTQSNGTSSPAGAYANTSASGAATPSAATSTQPSQQSLFDWESSYIANMTSHMPNIYTPFNAT